MKEETTRSAPNWRHRFPFLIGIVLCGLVFIYLVLPGVVWGLLFKTGMIARRSDDPAAMNMIETVFCVPLFIASTVPPIGNFYAWQMRFVGEDP